MNIQIIKTHKIQTYISVVNTTFEDLKSGFSPFSWHENSTYWPKANRLTYKNLITFIMLQVDYFTFNPFQENTYIVHDETRECIIIDPGCYTPAEKEELSQFIFQQKLKPVRLLNTHCHIDHVLGNKFVADTYNLQLELHLMEIPLLRAVTEYGPQYGIFPEPVPEPTLMIGAGDTIRFGNSSLKALFAPGHSPGSLCFYDEYSKVMISGDVLFQMSIGRTDLPGGNYNQLIKSITEVLFGLPDDVKVYPGHGMPTTIGFERKNNPFLT